MQETEKFNNYLKLFKHFTGEEEEEAQPPVREERDFPRDTIDKILGIQE